jgi:hypothetical protein
MPDVRRNPFLAQPHRSVYLCTMLPNGWPIRSMVLPPWGAHARYGALRHWPIANQRAELLRLARDEHVMDEGACPLSPVGVGSHVTS